MKHSTFYKVKGVLSVYTTIKLTDHHAYLRNAYNGKTFKHIDSAKTFFVAGFPLVEPIPAGEEIKE